MMNKPPEVPWVSYLRHPSNQRILDIILKESVAEADRQDRGVRQQ